LSLRNVQRPQRIKRIRPMEEKNAPGLHLALAGGDTRMKIDWEKTEFTPFSMTYIKKMSKIASHSLRVRPFIVNENLKPEAMQLEIP